MRIIETEKRSTRRKAPIRNQITSGQSKGQQKEIVDYVISLLVLLNDFYNYPWIPLYEDTDY